MPRLAGHLSAWLAVPLARLLSVFLYDVSAIDPDGSLIVDTALVGKPNTRRAVYIKERHVR